MGKKKTKKNSNLESFLAYLVKGTHSGNVTRILTIEDNHYVLKISDVKENKTLNIRLEDEEIDFEKSKTISGFC